MSCQPHAAQLHPVVAGLFTCDGHDVLILPTTSTHFGHLNLRFRHRILLRFSGSFYFMLAASMGWGKVYSPAQTAHWLRLAA